MPSSTLLQGIEAKLGYFHASVNSQAEVLAGLFLTYSVANVPARGEARPPVKRKPVAKTSVAARWA